jgi:hypothetical protein
MTDLAIDAPADFAPVTALAYSDADSTAIFVSPDRPLPVGELPFRGAIALSPDMDAAPGRGIAVAVSAAGTIRLKIADDSLISLPLEQGLAILPFAVKGFTAAGTSAVLTAHSLL